MARHMLQTDTKPERYWIWVSIWGFAMSELFRRFFRNQSGANIIEYVILAGFVALASVLASTDGANTLRALLIE